MLHDHQQHSPSNDANHLGSGELVVLKGGDLQARGVQEHCRKDMQVQPRIIMMWLHA